MVLGNQDNVLFPVSSLNLYQYVSPISVITMNVTGISYNGRSECHHLFGFALRLTLSHQPAARGSQNTERGNVWLRQRGEDTSTKRQISKSKTYLTLDFLAFALKILRIEKVMNN